MEFPRLPRFNRAPVVRPMVLTERDRAIIRLVHEHRFLRSSQIVALMSGSSQQVLRRLQLLFHHGYLARPRCQLEYFNSAGPRHMVYGLGSKGATILRPEMSGGVRKIRWGPKNRSVGRMFFEHALLVSDVMVAIEISCRGRGVRLLTESALTLPGKDQSFRWRAKIGSGLEVGVIPDRVFALEFPQENGTTKRAYFFLEADRGTMPVRRKGLSQTSFHRKLVAYEATWEQNLHRSRFGFHRFRVLTVAGSPARVESLVEACSQLERGHGLFLFADRTVLAGDILSAVWQTGKPGQTGRLMD